MARGAWDQTGARSSGAHWNPRRAPIALFVHSRGQRNLEAAAHQVNERPSPAHVAAGTAANGAWMGVRAAAVDGDALAWRKSVAIRQSCATRSPRALRIRPGRRPGCGGSRARRARTLQASPRAVGADV